MTACQPTRYLAIMDVRTRPAHGYAIDFDVRERATYLRQIKRCGETLVGEYGSYREASAAVELALQRARCRNR
jgi:hypothetical protein